MKHKCKIYRNMLRHSFLVLLAILTVPVYAAVTTDSIRQDSLFERVSQILAVAMESDSVIENNSPLIVNEVRSGDATPSQTEQVDKTDEWSLLGKYFSTYIYPIITLENEAISSLTEDERRQMLILQSKHITALREAFNKIKNHEEAE